VWRIVNRVRRMKGTIVRIFSVARRLFDEKGPERAREEAQVWHARFLAKGDAEEEERWRHILLEIERLEALEAKDRE
jgi:hypothetical protein